MQQTRRHLRLIALLTLFAFTMVACGTDYVQGTIITADGGSDGAVNWGIGGPGVSSDGASTPSGGIDQDVQTSREIIVLLNAEQVQVMAPNGLLPINVKVIDYAVGAPAAGVAVFYEVVENLNNGPGSLDSMMTGTDNKGLAGNVFRANRGPLQSYKVKIACEVAEPVFVRIDVTDTPKGAIRVSMKYDNQVAINQVTVRLMPMPFTCASFKPVYPPAGFIGSKSGFLNDKLTFEGLPADKKYGVYLIAKDPANHLVAAGCADGVLVLKNQTTEVTVTVNTLALQASGPYTMVNKFDFTGAIPGQLGEILDTAVKVFYEPGSFVISQVKNLIKQILPSIIVDAAFSLFEDALAKAVTNWLLNSSPKWLQDFFGIGQDVLQIVKKLEMLGLLKIFKVSNDFFVKGEINFTGLNLYWKLGCDKSKPNYDTCGKVNCDANKPNYATCATFDVSQASNDPNFPLDLIAGTLTGAISAQTQLTIDSSSIKLNYGKLILFVLTNVVLKQLTGETTFAGAMSKLVNCAGIAKGISQSILGKLGLKEKTVKNACDSAVALLVYPLEQLLGGLSLDSNLMLQGSGTLVDDKPGVTQGKDWIGDLKVDRIEKGLWTGTIVSGSPGKPFKGTWNATRKDF
ncbi:MAG TPA: hypothetical protein DCQ06_05800 [Myxococcales bacterium]|nr:hypothetical protein [Myxococcales bacterium]